MKTTVQETPHTWESRLAADQLQEEEYKVLRDMVESGEVESELEAARVLDFKDRELNMGDSFYGF